ncbi:MAG: type 4a pilus biogenesis protein PilO [Gemmatimonadaceae bacterium]
MASLNPRDRNLVVLSVLAVGLAGGYWYQFWSPKNLELDQVDVHVQALKDVNQRAKAELAQGKTSELRAETEQFERDLNVMRELVPTANEVPVLLEQVSTAARRVGLDISDVQPLPQLNGDQYDAYKYRMSVRGDYHQIGVFLTNIGTLQRIVAPINVGLNPTQQQTRNRAPRTQPLEARFEIQTYVARTAPAPKPGATKLEPEPSKPGER